MKTMLLLTLTLACESAPVVPEAAPDLSAAAPSSAWTFKGDLVDGGNYGPSCDHVKTVTIHFPKTLQTGESFRSSAMVCKPSSALLECVTDGPDNASTWRWFYVDKQQGLVMDEYDFTNGLHLDRACEYVGRGMPIITR